MIPARVLDEVPSTQAEAWALLESGQPPPFALRARAQASGRGREGRAFFSPRDGGLWASFALASARPPADLPAYGIALAVSAADALAEASGLEVDLRWPNDLMRGSRKLGGVLAESRARPGGGAWLVLGLGVNLSVRDFPPELAGIAGSAATEGGRVPDPDRLLAGVSMLLECHAGALERGERAGLERAWKAQCRTLGRPVRIDLGAGALPGTVLDLDLDGLLLATGAGPRRIPSGHVRELREIA